MNICLYIYVSYIYVVFSVFYRCYNCGDFANHIAAKCPKGPLPKTCHHCKSAEHLIADCPQREVKKKDDNDNDNDNGAESPSAEGSSSAQVT